MGSSASAASPRSGLSERAISSSAPMAPGVALLPAEHVLEDVERAARVAQPGEAQPAEADHQVVHLLVAAGGVGELDLPDDERGQLGPALALGEHLAQELDRVLVVRLAGEDLPVALRGQLLVGERLLGQGPQPEQEIDLLRRRRLDHHHPLHHRGQLARRLRPGCGCGPAPRAPPCSAARAGPAPRRRGSARSSRSSRSDQSTASRRHSSVEVALVTPRSSWSWYAAASSSKAPVSAASRSSSSRASALSGISPKARTRAAKARSFCPSVSRRLEISSSRGSRSCGRGAAEADLQHLHQVPDVVQAPVDGLEQARGVRADVGQLHQPLEAGDGVRVGGGDGEQTRVALDRRRQLLLALEQLGARGAGAPSGPRRWWRRRAGPGRRPAPRSACPGRRAGRAPRARPVPRRSASASL